MGYDFEAMRKKLEDEYERLDHQGTGHARQVEITKELADLNKKEKKWKRLRAAAESISTKLLT